MLSKCGISIDKAFVVNLKIISPSNFLKMTLLQVTDELNKKVNPYPANDGKVIIQMKMSFDTFALYEVI